jgi:FtsP/CotA-like multicopper oxidase with cupredoxin domain
MTININRRNFIKLSGFTFSLPLLPSLIQASTAKNINASYVLMAKTGHQTLISPNADFSTDMWAYNDSSPGPLLRLKQNAKTRIHLINKLTQSTSIHWHGLRIDNAMDGVPNMTQKPVKSMQSFTYDFTPPDAGTYWYHPHSRPWEQMERGLYGAIIVEESEPVFCDQDIVLLIDDVQLDMDYQIKEDFDKLGVWAHGGRMGNFLLVNGKPKETISTRKGERLRLRLINVANSRMMQLRVNEPNKHIIAVDGQPVQPQKFQNDIVLAPGQRVDLIVDVFSEEKINQIINFVYRGKTIELVNTHYIDSKIVRSSPSKKLMVLPPNPLEKLSLDVKSAKTVSVDIEGGAMGRLREARYKGKLMPISELIQNSQIWAMNGIAGLDQSPLFKAEAGTTIILDIKNNNNWPHAMHIHGHHFKELNIVGDDYTLGVWRDTILLESGENKKIIFNADNKGSWLFHCHMLEHAAGGMISWFEIN